MAFLFIFGVVFSMLILYLTIHNLYLKRRGLPPGPTPLPIIGNLLSIVRRPPGEDCYLEWRQKYGPIYTFWSGEQPMIIIADYKIIIDTVQRDGETYAGRFLFDDIERLVKGDQLGVVFTDGELWREQRRFCLRVFRDLGKNFIQEKILDEVIARFAELDEQIAQGSKLCDIADMFDVSITSFINSILLGYRFDKNHDAEFMQLKKLILNYVHSISHPVYLIMSPNPHLYIKFPLFRRYVDDARHCYQTLLEFFKGQIEEHIREITLDDSDDVANDFVAMFLREKRKRDSAGQANDHYTLDQLAHLCFDIWGAGQETTSVTMSWAVAYVIHNPDVQRRIHTEIDNVIGSTDQLITMEDRNLMPYTCAVINESQRIANLLPLNLPHRTTRDTYINGHFVPRGTCVIPQISTVLYDEKIFPQPRSFIPERFLDENGRLKKCDELMPFSIGKRQCLGEGLARQELFLFTANFFNRYKVYPGNEMPSLERSIGVIAYCPKFKCRVERRIAYKKSVVRDI